MFFVVVFVCFLHDVVSRRQVSKVCYGIREGMGSMGKSDVFVVVQWN